MSQVPRLLWEDFPADEYRSRLSRAQAKMSEAEIDVLVLTQPENVEYFSGFQTGHWPAKTFNSGIVVLHRSMAPTLIIPAFFEGNAIGCSWIENRFLVSEPHASPRSFGPALVKSIYDYGDVNVVAMERGTHLMPFLNLEDYELLRGLTHLEFVPGGEVIWGCRMVKSAREIERMRWLSEITCDAIQSARLSLRPGWTERQVATHIKRELLVLGADGAGSQNVRAGLERYGCSDSVPQDREIGNGEILLIDSGAVYRSYVTDIAYVTHVGRATSEHHREYGWVVAAQQAAIEAARPGARASSVFAAAHSVLENSPLRSLDMVGHGIGMDVHEPPMLAPYDDTVLVPGMVFSMEPWLYDVDRLGLFAVEEMVLITESGAEVMCTVNRDSLMEVI